MSNTITLSLNELSALVCRTLEATYGHGLDFQEAAKQIVWLESLGLDGIERLLENSPWHCSGDLTAHYTNENGLHVFDMRDGNMLPALICAADILIAETKTMGGGRVEMRNCINGELLAATVAQCARRDLAAAVIWPGHEGRESFVAHNCEDHECVEYLTISDTGFRTPLHPTVVAGKTQSSVSTAICDHLMIEDLSQLVVVKSGAQLRAAHQMSIDIGVTLGRDNYSELMAIADRVLVETNDVSRRGAGD